MARRRQGITLEGMSFEFYNKSTRKTDIYSIGHMQGRPGKTSISEHQVFKNGEPYKWVDIRDIMGRFNVTHQEALDNTIKLQTHGSTKKTSRR